jgi:small-conductance mechanosensitive channel
MKVAFPVLLVNLFTLLLSIILAAWIGAEIFNIRLTPLLATSAIFSLVLGLAMQDTLGNLFAGVALQFDKPYEIGDWIEIQTNGHKWTGQVYEISWRATVLISFTEEAITVPNRVVAQAQVSNFSTKYRPIIRSQTFRLPFGVDIDQVKYILIQVAASTSEIRKTPAPKVYVSETTESWLGFRLIYFIDNYGSQFFIADKILSQGIAQLEKAGFQLASHRITLQQNSQL